MLNLRGFAMRLLRARCHADCLLFTLKMSGSEFAMKGIPFADLNFGYCCVLEPRDWFSPQPVFGKMHCLQSSLGLVPLRKRFLSVSGVNQNFTVP